MRSKVIAAVLILCLILSGCSQSDQETANDIDSVELKSNQEIVIAKITQINGNEMTYTVAKEADTSTQSDKDSSSSGQMQGPPEQPGGDQSSADTSKQSGSDDQSSADTSKQSGLDSQSSADTSKQSGSDSQSSADTSKQSGSDSQSSADTSKQSGSDQQSSSDHTDGQSGLQKPDGAPSSSGGDMQGPPDGNMPSEKSSSDQTSSDNSSKKNKVAYTLTDETGTMMIPVGTKVITSLGKETTFSRLANGDVIKMIVEKDSDGNKVIVGIWIV